MFDTYALWIGRIFIGISGAFAIGFMIYLFAEFSFWLQHKCLGAFGGWKTFLEYVEWYHKNKKGGA